MATETAGFPQEVHNLITGLLRRPLRLVLFSVFTGEDDALGVGISAADPSLSLPASEGTPVDPLLPLRFNLDRAAAAARILVSFMGGAACA